MSLTGSAEMIVEAILARAQRENADLTLFGPIVLDGNNLPYFLLVIGEEFGTARLTKIGAPDDESLEAVRANATRKLQLKGVMTLSFADERRLIDVGSAYWPEDFVKLRALVDKHERTSLH